MSRTVGLTVPKGKNRKPPEKNKDEKNNVPDNNPEAQGPPKPPEKKE